MTVAVLPLYSFISASFIQPYFYNEDERGAGEVIHSSKPQNARHNPLNPPRHMQVPDNKNRKQPERPVRNGIQQRPRKRRVHDQRRRDAVLAVRTPPLRYGYALETCQKQKEEAEYGCPCHCDSEDPDVSCSDCDAEEEEAD